MQALAGAAMDDTEEHGMVIEATAGAAGGEACRRPTPRNARKDCSCTKVHSRARSISCAPVVRAARPPAFASFRSPERESTRGCASSGASRTGDEAMASRSANAVRYGGKWRDTGSSRAIWREMTRAKVAFILMQVRRISRNFEEIRARSRNLRATCKRRPVARSEWGQSVVAAYSTAVSKARLLSPWRT
eukprot:scaffold86281_cov27-Tisochrysis_lutea.AAC.5